MSYSSPQVLITRLIHGRALYVLLGICVVLLYWHAIRMRTIGPSEVVSMAPVEVTEMNDWTDDSIDAEAFRQLAVDKPALAFFIILLGVYGIAMALGGCALSSWAIATGKVRSLWKFHAPRIPKWSYGELGRVTFLIVAVASLIPFMQAGLLDILPALARDDRLWMASSMLVFDTFVIMLILAFATSKGKSLTRLLGFTGKKFRISVKVGFRWYLAVFPWIFLMLFVIARIWFLMGFDPPVEPIHELIFQEDRWFVFMLTLLLACIVGPVAEELFFRGVVYTAIRHKTTRLKAVLINGALFSLMHTNVVGFLPIMLLGCLLALLYERTGSLASPLMVHILHNTFLITLTMSLRQAAAV